MKRIKNLFKKFFIKLKKRTLVKVLLYIGIALLLVGGVSYAYLSFNIKGDKTNLVKAGCLKVDFSEENNISLLKTYPISNEEGSTLTPYSYTITNSCNLDAYYETTLNVLTTSGLGNEDKINLYLTGDNFFNVTRLDNFDVVELNDKPSDVRKSYLFDTGYIAPGETKKFKLRMWIDYNATNFNGAFNTRVIVDAIADEGPAFISNTTGYQLLSRNLLTLNTPINPNYSSISPSVENEQTSGLFKEEGTNSNYTYYYRGNVTNNYVKFGKYKNNTTTTYTLANGTTTTVNHTAGDDMIWRIIRINEDGTIRMILDDLIGESSYTSDATVLNNGTYTSSTIKGIVDSFYATNLEEDYQNYLSPTDFCLDNTYSEAYTESYNRNITSNEPTVACPLNNTYNSYIGLITTDEVAMAGNLYNVENNNSYLFKNSNGWYTISPAKYEGSIVYNMIFNSDINITRSDVSYGIRPVISLANNYVLKGTGTSENPYEIDTIRKTTSILTINSNGGTYNGISENTLVELGDEEELTLSTPERENYDFDGWTVSNCIVEGNILTMGDEDATLTAKWEYRPQITINPNGGTYNGSISNTLLRSSSNTTNTLLVPTRANYTFAGWEVSGTGGTTEGNTVTVTTNDVIITAKWLLTISSFAYTGVAPTSPYQAFPGTYKLEVWGAEGGYRSSTTYSGKGGYSYGTLSIPSTTNLYVFVGGSGNSGTCANNICVGGFNGGGYRHTYKGGGGATDVRIGSTSLYARVIVAGGGGSDGSSSRNGMYGGGTTGGTSTQNYSGNSYCGYGGNTTYSGYSTSYTTTTQPTTTLTGSTQFYGGFGFGGGGLYRVSGYGGAGGGGWYGGSGTYPDTSGDDDRGGGGGSGYVYTSSTYSQYPSGCLLNSNYYLTSAATVNGGTSFTDYSGTSVTGHSGNGAARITVISLNY